MPKYRSTRRRPRKSTFHQRRLLLEKLEDRRLLHGSPFDTSGDGSVTSLDALQVINAVSRDGLAEENATIFASAATTLDLSPLDLMSPVEAVTIAQSFDVPHRPQTPSHNAVDVSDHFEMIEFSGLTHHDLEENPHHHREVMPVLSVFENTSDIAIPKPFFHITTLLGPSCAGEGCRAIDGPTFVEDPNDPGNQINIGAPVDEHIHNHEQPPSMVYGNGRKGDDILPSLTEGLADNTPDHVLPGEKLVLNIGIHMSKDHPPESFTFKVDIVNLPECTLRAAIMEANVKPNRDTIVFNSPGRLSVNSTADHPDNDLTDGVCSTGNYLWPAERSGPWSIGVGTSEDAFQQPLPAVIHPVVIDGTTQPGIAQPIVELDGTVVDVVGPDGVDQHGLELRASRSTVRGLVINEFPGNGIQLSPGADFATIEGNHIGTDLLGTVEKPNNHGIVLDNVRNSTIGGKTPAARNVISGNRDDGIHITGKKATTNKVLGNFIGTDATGLDEIPNKGDGVEINGAPSNSIGGTRDGEANVISGNDGSGIHINGLDSRSNKVLGNTIGLDVNAFEPLSNLLHGVIIDGAPDNKIGSAGGGKNIISINGLSGVAIVGKPSKGNVVVGNYIGLDATGTKHRGNERGVHIVDAPSNTIGGAGRGEGNVISANSKEGVRIALAGATNNQVIGNYIGTDFTGDETIDSDLGNGAAGVAIIDAPNNSVGRGQATARNVISGNESDGVRISGPTAKENKVLGNHIGTNKSGNTDRGNTGDGVHIDNAPDNVIGGRRTTERNVISGNDRDGVHIAGVLAARNLVQRNYVGTDHTAAKPVGNGRHGVFVNDAPETIVSRNVISANKQDGVGIFGPAATKNRVEWNQIGTNWRGTEDLGNKGNGVTITDADENIIGLKNVISGNDHHGVEISGIDAERNKVLGNYIGTKSDGANALPNTKSGVLIDNASDNLVGLPGRSNGNVISGNQEHGVHIRGSIGARNSVLGNLIGTNRTGTGRLSNKLNGVSIENSWENTIGSRVAPNVISANQQHGVKISGVASLNVVKGNLIGVNKTGARVLPNDRSGVLIESAKNRVGSKDAANVISGNREHGVHITGTTALDNTIESNFVGTNASGRKFGNRFNGVRISDGASSNRIGSDINGVNDKMEANTIAFNGSGLAMKGHGVVIQKGTGNAVRGNSIHSNEGRGIDLWAEQAGTPVDDAFSTNDVGDADRGANNLQDYPVITRITPIRGPGVTPGTTIEFTLDSTAATTFDIDYYSNTALDPSGFGEGRTYLLGNSVQQTTDATGRTTWTKFFAASLSFIAVTATDPDGNTSEFSMIDTDGDALADAWETSGIDVNEDGTIDLTLTGANPNHKDLYLEMDAMNEIDTNGDGMLNGAEDANGNGSRDNYAPAAVGAGVSMVAAFAAAPEDLVHNPDAADGITVHGAITDENTIQAVAWTPATRWAGFNAIKAASFGTVAERGNPNWTNIRAAKMLTHRYVLWAVRHSGNSSGIAEDIEASNDCMVTLGSVDGGTQQQQQTTLMHEFGHTLGLKHGGGDNVNYKPNYHSIMNYTWQFQEPVTGNAAFRASWQLDYSRERWPDLNEAALNEHAGIGGHVGHTVRVGPAGAYNYVPESGPADYNGSGSIQNPIAYDLNGSGGHSVLTGYDDWSNLDFYFIENLNNAFADGVHPNEEGGLVLNGSVNSVSPDHHRVAPGPLELNEVVSVAYPYDPSFQRTVGLSTHCDATLDAALRTDNEPRTSRRIGISAVERSGRRNTVHRRLFQNVDEAFDASRLRERDLEKLAPDFQALDTIFAEFDHDARYDKPV